MLLTIALSEGGCYVLEQERVTCKDQISSLNHLNNALCRRSNMWTCCKSELEQSLHLGLRRVVLYVSIISFVQRARRHWLKVPGLVLGSPKRLAENC